MKALLIVGLVNAAILWISLDSLPFGQKAALLVTLTASSLSVLRFMKIRW